MSGRGAETLNLLGGEEESSMPAEGRGEEEGESKGPLVPPPPPPGSPPPAPRMDPAHDAYPDAMLVSEEPQPMSLSGPGAQRML